MGKELNLKLKVWRQDNTDDSGRFEEYDAGAARPTSGPSHLRPVRFSVDYGPYSLEQVREIRRVRIHGTFTR